MGRQAFKTANNAWAQVTCEQGFGYLGPENLIVNRDQKLSIAIGRDAIVFGKADVRSIDVVCATSDWIKYAILLKNGKRYIATFMARPCSDNRGEIVPTALLNFEWWMADIIYKSPTSYNATTNQAQQNTPTLTNSSQCEIKTDKEVKVQTATQSGVKDNKEVKVQSVKPNLTKLQGMIKNQEVKSNKDYFAKYNASGGKMSCPYCLALIGETDTVCKSCGSKFK